MRILVGFPPGGSADVVARHVGDKLAPAFARSVIVDNRPGAASIIGGEVAAKAPNNGYTLFMGNNSTHGSNPALYSKLPYDAIRDFMPIIYVAATPYVLSVHPSMPVKTLKELVAFAKTRPGQMQYATSGVGANAHLSMVLLLNMTGLSMVHVPYRSTPSATTDVIAGHVPLMMANIVVSVPHVRSNRLRAYGVTSVGVMAVILGVVNAAVALAVSQQADARPGGGSSFRSSS